MCVYRYIYICIYTIIYIDVHMFTYMYIHTLTTYIYRMIYVMICRYTYINGINVGVQYRNVDDERMCIHGTQQRHHHIRSLVSDGSKHSSSTMGGSAIKTVTATLTRLISSHGRLCHSDSH